MVEEIQAHDDNIYDQIDHIIDVPVVEKVF